METIICAEGFLFEMERRGYLQAGPFVPEVVLENPDAVLQLHKEFKRAGSDVTLAFTYYAHRDKLKRNGREIDLEEMNRQALRLAKQAGGRLGGNICNTWAYDPKTENRDVVEIFREQVQWAKEEGAELIVGETFSYLGEALLALRVIKEFDLFAVITLAPFNEKTLDGYEYTNALKILEKKGADIVGFNCGRGPETMLPLLKDAAKEVSVPLAALPVPYRTTSKDYTFQHLKHRGKKAFPTNLDPFLISREEAANFAVEAQNIGVSYIGLCCGAGPHHIRAIAEVLGRKPEASKYSPNMSKHEALGDKEFVKECNKVFTRTWD